MQGRDRDTASSHRSVVVGFDASAGANDALALAETLAELLGSNLVLACVYPFDPRVWTPSFEDERQAALREAPVRRFQDRSVERVALDASSPARGLHEFVRERDAELLVVGSTNRGPVGRVLLGSTGRKLLHGGACSVAVAPRGYGGKAAGLGTIAVAFDGSEESRLAASEASRLAFAANATLRVLSVVDTFGSIYLGVQKAAVLEIVEDALRERVQHLLGALPVTVRAEARVLRGPATGTLLREAEAGVDLLVMGSRAYGPVGSVLLGSVSSQVIDSSPCPVLLVPRGVSAPAPAHDRASLSQLRQPAR